MKLTESITLSRAERIILKALLQRLASLVSSADVKASFCLFKGSSSSTLQSFLAGRREVAGQHAIVSYAFV